MNLRDHMYEKLGLNPSPMTQLRRAAASSAIINQFGLFRFLFLFQFMPVGTAQFGQADLFKKETHTETPMTELGRTIVSSEIIKHI